MHHFKPFSEFKLELRVLKCSIQAKIGDLKFMSYVTWNLTNDVTVLKLLNCVLTSVTFTFDLWSFAWTSRLSMVITPENFRMIRWQEHCEKYVMDWQMDRSVLRAAWSQLKIQYDHQAAILKVTSVKNNMFLPTATSHKHTEFETEMPKQTWVMLQKPCHLQSLQTKKSNMAARQPFWRCLSLKINSRLRTWP